MKPYKYFYKQNALASDLHESLVRNRLNLFSDVSGVRIINQLELRFL